MEELIEQRLSEGIIDGKLIAQEFRAQLIESIVQEKLAPFLAAILVGDDEASKLYVSMKERACKKMSIGSKIYRLPANCSANKLEILIKELNLDSKVDGILLQLPLPSHLDPLEFTSLIDPRKDVDGLNFQSVGRFQLGLPGFVPCTPAGCLYLLKRSHVSLSGSEVVIIGRSNLVGRPLLRLLEKENATVTLCHSRTRNLKKHTLNADIVVSAAGRVKLVTADMIKEGAVVIDVGTNAINGKLVGDVDFKEASLKSKLITPVPGGVGPMTITMLLSNTIDAHRNLGS